MRGLAGKDFLWILVMAVLMLFLGAMTLIRSPHPDSATSQAFYLAVARALDENTPMSRGRLVSATLTDDADATVEFVLRDGGGDGRENRPVALADILAIARAAYMVPEPRLVDVTVIGLAWRPSRLTTYTPVLYASLPADRLVELDWPRVGSSDVTALAGVRWFPRGLCRAWRECGATVSPQMSALLSNARRDAMFAIVMPAPRSGLGGVGIAAA